MPEAYSTRDLGPIGDYYQREKILKVASQHRGGGSTDHTDRPHRPYTKQNFGTERARRSDPRFV